jgi:transposase
MIMRNDVAKSISKYTQEEITTMNKSEIARRLGCDRRTVKRYIELSENPEKTKAKRTRRKLMDDYENVVIDKVDKYGVTAMAAYKFIQKNGYTGQYCTVANYVRKHKQQQNQKAVIRFETMPGLQAQVDWKESVKMVNRQGEEIVVNIFMMVLGYSRLKYLKLTNDRTQHTLFTCLIGGMSFYGGVPHEILFDNMSTVVDRARTSFQHVVLNDKFRCFADDAGFEPLLCRAYRAQTKGKVESLAKLVGRLKVYNDEFDTFEELEAITESFMHEINSEISQATDEMPLDRFKREKEHLRPLPNMHLLSSYVSNYKDYTVSLESMINYKGRKYSVPIYYIGKKVNVIEVDNKISIYYNGDFICSFDRLDTKLNYKREHVHEILASDVLSHFSAYEIDDFIENNLSRMDILLD